MKLFELIEKYGKFFMSGSNTWYELSYNGRRLRYINDEVVVFDFNPYLPIRLDKDDTKLNRNVLINSHFDANKIDLELNGMQNHVDKYLLMEKLK